MTIVGAGALLGAIVATGVAMRPLIDNWCKTSQELKDFDRNLELLRQEQHIWEAEIHKVGLEDDPELMALLGWAQKSLDEQNVRLAKLATGKSTEDGAHGRWWRMLKWSVFPSELPIIIESATKVFDHVLHGLSRAEDIATKLQTKVLNRAPPFEFRSDHRYVPLELTNREVMCALENSSGPSVVLLHGAPGRGKSSLARDVALQFQQRIDKDHKSDDAATSEDTREASTAACSPVFEQVVFLECGPEVDLQAKQSELRGKLGWSTTSNEAAPVVADGQSVSKISLAKSLESLLRSRALLVILDDVWNRDFLQAMIHHSGKDVKWLVTSQLGDLCKHCNLSQRDFIAIPMEVAKQEDARKILAGHIGLWESVTSEVEGFMNSVIEKVDANPLALACVAPAIDADSYNDKREWEKLDEELSNLLDCKAESLLHSKGYDRSFWQAHQVGFGLLSKPHQNLLILIHMCKGPSISESIIEYLFEHTRDRSCYVNFSQARRTLKERHLVKVACNDTIAREENTRSWSIHFLLRQFIREKYFSNNGTLIWETLSNMGILLDHSPMECEREWNVLIAIVALYFESNFHKELVEKFATKMHTPLCTFQLVGTRGYVIEPIAQLLVRREDTKWTPVLHASSREVLLEYSDTGKIHQNGVSTLLDSSLSSNHMLTTLSRLRDVDKHTFFGEKVVSSLLRLLESECICTLSGNPGGIRRPPPPLLNRIAGILEGQLGMSDCRPDDQDKIHLSNVFEQLSAGLAKMDAYDLQICSATALADLVNANDYEKEKAVAAAGLLEGLGIAMRNDGCQQLQIESVRAIANLACGDKCCRSLIFNRIGTLEALVAGLKKEEDYFLQYYSACALANLAYGLSRVGLKITNCRGALHALVAGLHKGKSHRLQSHSSRALTSLACTTSEAKWEIIKLDGALESLMSLTAELHQDEDGTEAMMWSAGALSFLASGADGIKEAMMLKCPGMVDDLVSAMTALVSSATNKMEENRDWTVSSIMTTVTLLNPGRAKEMHLDSAAAYHGRGEGELQLGLYHESLQDFNECEVHLRRRGSTIEDRRKPFLWSLLCRRCCAKAKSGDLDGALADANIWTESGSEVDDAWQEKGIVKHMMGDLYGALTDLDESLSIDPDDFEALKHRGYVKFLLNDKEGARADAEKALQIRQDYGDPIDYSSSMSNSCLGISSVQYLNFDL